MRFVYARYRTYQSALDSLEDSYATGDILPGEGALIERINGAWCITLPGA